MLPRPSRLKSLASEFSPVLTTPPPVDPNTVLVLMSVPEMMLSSNLVVLRRRAAIRPAMPASRTSAPAATAQVGVLPNRSSMNDGSGVGDFFGVGALTGGGAASTFGAGGGGCDLVSGAVAGGGG